MNTIKEIYKIGYGPSSSHTMGPQIASSSFLKEHGNYNHYRITLLGSLAATGKGHLTDAIIEKEFSDKKYEIIWEPDKYLEYHPNALKIEAFDENNSKCLQKIYYSVGGGNVVEEGQENIDKHIYEYTTLNDILNWCFSNGKQIWEYVDENEESDIWDYLEEVWESMKASVKKGLATEGALPGPLKLPRKASSWYSKILNYKNAIKNRALVYAYALAVSEENAGGGKIVTAPTCGSCGVLPAILYQHKTLKKASKSQILKALATAGIIGNIIKENASISGAEVGCQGEIGTACAMASAAKTQMSGGSIYQIEYAAEMGLEHHLGLTCDPLFGLVQVPCIERNAFAASRALNHKDYALLSDGKHLVSFDQVVETMKNTGKDLPGLYRETSKGGLALLEKRIRGEV